MCCKTSSYNVMPIITIVILVNSRQDKTRQVKAREVKRRRNIHRFVAYNDHENDNDNDNDNDNNNDNHYSMNSDGMKIIS